MTNTIKKLLVANRGEIACRVMRTAKKLGIKTVAVYSDADEHAQHVLQADEAVRIGPAPSSASYLNVDAVITAAGLTGADAIHPGYGFLSENAGFAKACEKNNIIFVGPPAAAIEAMGSKAAAKQIMEAAGVPLLPGYHGDEQAPEVLQKAADEMGYPVLLKAVAGGGGKGMRQVASSKAFSDALATAKREAMSSFGDDVMLVEKFLTRPRHVEVQVFFDQQGNGVYLFERDCSVQRRHQKIIEEAPAPKVSAELRQALGEAAVKAGAAINYVGAGTVEFLLDEDGTFYFMEMNTRLQVEHPVTEMITGQDLVAWQIRVAEGGELPLRQEALAIHGHAFEARIYAEDPDDQFLPRTGVLDFYQIPNIDHDTRHVRVDTGVVQGDEISVHYDPMIAKLVAWDTDRERALSRLEAALAEYKIAGVTTNIKFLTELTRHPAFQSADLSTAFITEHESDLFQPVVANEVIVAKIALFLAVRLGHDCDSQDPWQQAGWQLNSPSSYQQALEVAGEVVSVTVTLNSNEFRLKVSEKVFNASAQLHADQLNYVLDGYRGTATVYFDGHGGKWFEGASHVSFAIPAKDFGEEAGGADGGFTAPMNGTVVSVPIKAGDKVAAGTVLVVMEAMKMEHAICAPADGEVIEVFCEAGQLVDGGSVLVAFEATDE